MSKQFTKGVYLAIIALFLFVIVGQALAAESTWDSIHQRKSLRIGVVQAPP
jgi:hypothetical protein